MAETIFEKIIQKEIPARIVYEDERAMAFADINPVAPTHLLVVPKTHLSKLSDASHEHESLLGHLLLTANRVAKEAGLSDFRVVVNNGAAVGQSVFHLHVHVIGGRSMAWPPG